MRITRNSTVEQRDFIPGQPVMLANGLLRVVAPNPGPMTGPGTNTYVLGFDALTVIDPGPASEQHIADLKDLGDIRQIIVTHTHRDHSPAASVLAERTGARTFGRPPPADGRQDASFVPDAVLADADIVNLDGFSLEVIATPGHASNHLCYFVREFGWLLTGDHIMGGSTVVIAPPDGDMDAYFRSLERLKRLRLTALLPGHGAVIEQPRSAIDGLLRHRLGRETKVVAALDQRLAKSLDELLVEVYADVPVAVHPVAKLSLLAHLERLASQNGAMRQGDRWRGTGFSQES